MKDGIYKSETWIYNPKQRLLKIGAQKIKLRNHVHLVFLILIKNAGELCQSNHLMTEVWGETNSSGFSGLRTAIWELRQHVKEIDTYPRKGYSLNCRVRFVEHKTQWLKLFRWF